MELRDLGKNIEFDVNYTDPKRGEVYIVSLSDMSVGNIHVLQKDRYAVVIQNDMGNKFSDTVIIALMSSSQKKLYPMHYKFNLNGSSIESIIIFEQILTVDKTRLIEKKGELTPKQMREAEEKLMYSLQLNRFNLSNVKDIEVVNRNHVKTRTENYYNFGIQIMFINNEILEVNIKLEKLKEFDNSIDENIDFDLLREKLDCIRGMNFLVNNNDL